MGLMAHNLSLPIHRYVWVLSSFVLKSDEPVHLIPAVWFGVSVTPDRMMGCHVVLENGAMVIDLPLHALRHTANADLSPQRPSATARWDMYGFDAEIFAPPYMVNTRVQLLDTNHKPTNDYGQAWFAVDHLTDGYALDPAQHKHLWVVALDITGLLRQVPQDQLMVHDWSFTEVDDIPQIKRQSTVWRAE
jgi:hypothetical protein